MRFILISLLSTSLIIMGVIRLVYEFSDSPKDFISYDDF